MTAVATSPVSSRSWLGDLEDEAIHILREVAGQFERPVLLFSGGKDSAVLLHLATKAFWPGRVPFPVMHVDTGHDFAEVIEFRDRHVARLGVKLVVAGVQDSIDRGRVQETPGQPRNPLQTVTLLDAVNEHRFDAVLGGARHDEKARAEERIFSVRDDFGQWDPRSQRPELWDLYNGRHRRGEHVRVFPISNWTELDIWAYIEREGVEVPSIYYAHERPVIQRAGEAAMEDRLLRVVTAGSVDDGKSTLVGRLLHDAKVMLADGLRAEREQGITIDVAYRYFATANRTFVLADTPGHVQYIRNTVTGASTADVAVILVDARNGVLDQTKRHAAVAALLRVEHIVLAVNKMDLVDFAEPAFDTIVTDFAAAAASLGLDTFTPIPVSALSGDNVVEGSPNMPWYAGPPLLGHLEQIEPRAAAAVPARFPVQIAMRPRTEEHPDYRGYAGRVEAGPLRVGDQVVVLPSARTSTVAGIDTPDGSLAEAAPGRSVVVRLADDLDVSRGDLVAADRSPRPAVVREFTATVCWLCDRALRVGDRFALRHTTRDVRAIVDAVESRLDIATLAHDETDGLRLNDIGIVRLRTTEPLAVDPYSLNRSTGAFLLVDENGGATVAAGMVAVTP